MWKTIKNISITCGIALLGIFLYLARSGLIRSRVRNDFDIDERIKRGNQAIEDGLSDLGSSLEEGAKTVGDITERAISIEDKLSAAISILEGKKQKD